MAIAGHENYLCAGLNEVCCTLDPVRLASMIDRHNKTEAKKKKELEDQLLLEQQKKNQN